MSRGNGLYTKYDAERVAQLHSRLHGVHEVIVYGAVARGHQSERIHLLLVVQEESRYQMFVEHLKEHRVLYASDMSEIESKLMIAQSIWGEDWPQWHDYKEHVDKLDDIEITVVPFNWNDRLDELDKHFKLSNLSRMYTYAVA